jgi:Na+/H+ antiporter NhaD/arsenite permease-like protein
MESFSMLVASFSIFAIIAAIAIGNFRRINIGLVSIAFAFIIGYFMVEIPAAEIVAGWPLNLFFVLLGMTLLFGIARVNGTLSLLARKTVEATLGKTWLIPLVFFIMSGVLAALGPGNISICALVLPIAMAIAVDHHISPLLMATMVIAGSNAGGLSPIAPTGIIADSLSTGQGLDISMDIFHKQIIAQSIFACILYFLMKGHRLKKSSSSMVPSEPLNRVQITTAIVLAIVVLVIVFGRWNIGLTAFAGSAILLFLKAADEKTAINSVPWSTIILVCGVTMLVKVSESAGGIQLLSQYLTRLMDTQTVAPIMAVISGMLSLVSSSSGVVMPTLIPTVPGLAVETGGDPIHITSAIIIGAHMVTNSPISTLGALALSSVGKEVDKIKFFNDLFLIGIAGLFYAALIVYMGIV